MLYWFFKDMLHIRSYFRIYTNLLKDEQKLQNSIKARKV